MAFFRLGLSLIVLIYYVIRWLLSPNKIDNKNSDDLAKIVYYQSMNYL